MARIVTYVEATENKASKAMRWMPISAPIINPRNEQKYSAPSCAHAQ